MEKAKRAKYTLEFMQEAVRLVESGQLISGWNHRFVRSLLPPAQSGTK